MYPVDIEESMAKVEATRRKRLEEDFSRFTPEVKTQLLHAFHPDFVEKGMRELVVGLNKGDRAPNELADLLEGNSRIDPDKINIKTIDYDSYSYCKF